MYFFFFFNDTATTEIYTLSLHDALPILDEQKSITTKGGTMRLGSYPCEIRQGTLAHKIYGADLAAERHRHRYEFNNRSEEHTSELQSRQYLVCRLLLEKKKKKK